MGKRGRKGTVISRLRDIRSSSYRKAQGFRQCQLAQWSWIRAGELASYIIVIWFSLCSYSSPASIPKEMEVVLSAMWSPAWKYSICIYSTWRCVFNLWPWNSKAISDIFNYYLLFTWTLLWQVINIFCRLIFTLIYYWPYNSKKSSKH